MKREAPRHHKVIRLRQALGCSFHEAVGVLEMLWHTAAELTPRGDIGRLADAELAEVMRYERDPIALVHALVTAGWLDEHPEHRLVVHDWSEHCQDHIHMHLARRQMTFADGTLPKKSRLAQTERKRVRTACARRAHTVRTTSPHLTSPPDSESGGSSGSLFQESKPLVVSGGGTRGNHAPPAMRSAPRATREDLKRPFPDDLTLTADRQAFAEVGGINARLEWAKFRDHALATNARYANWDAAWKNWVRNVEHFSRRRL